VALFAVGCVAGIIASGAVTPGDALRERLLTARTPGFGSALLNSARFPLAALFFAFSVLGVAGIPSLTALRGFLLCFSLTVTVRAFGGAGVPLALASVLPAAMFSVPSLLALSAVSLDSARGLGRAVAGAKPLCGTAAASREFFVKAAVCLLVCAAGAAVESAGGGALTALARGVISRAAQA
ncbi:MAG: stage II sporulation protein M, partial [Oscillospiraceae bacterium]|nr:stage II sporulation protein M [Oscillospiraceae bacterium]